MANLLPVKFTLLRHSLPTAVTTITNGTRTAQKVKISIVATCARRAWAFGLKTGLDALHLPPRCAVNSSIPPNSARRWMRRRGLQRGDTMATSQSITIIPPTAPTFTLWRNTILFCKNGRWRLRCLPSTIPPSTTNGVSVREWMWLTVLRFIGSCLQMSIPRSGCPRSLICIIRAQTSRAIQTSIPNALSIMARVQRRVTMALWAKSGSTALIGLI